MSFSALSNSPTKKSYRQTWNSDNNNNNKNNNNSNKNKYNQVDNNDSNAEDKKEFLLVVQSLIEGTYILVKILN